jgi:hypothetical protein
VKSYVPVLRLGEKMKALLIDSAKSVKEYQYVPDDGGLDINCW